MAVHREKLSGSTEAIMLFCCIFIHNILVLIFFGMFRSVLYVAPRSYEHRLHTHRVVLKEVIN